jgi:DNA-binding response OmpR family regulator
LAKILVVEDDEDLATALVDGLTAQRYIVEHADDGADALYLLQMSAFDLIVLDWQLPNMTGVQIIEEHRRAGGRTPIIMLTGLSTIKDKTIGLEAGADDYLTKPFDIRELLLRIKALLRRSSPSVSNVLTVGRLTLDSTRYVVTKAGKELRIAPREFALLEFFMRHPGETFSTETLLSRVYASDAQASNEGLRMAIMRLREAIDVDEPSAAKDSLIENIPRVGYRLKERS